LFVAVPRLTLQNPFWNNPHELKYKLIFMISDLKHTFNDSGRLNSAFIILAWDNIAHLFNNYFKSVYKKHNNLFSVNSIIFIPNRMERNNRAKLFTSCDMDQLKKAFLTALGELRASDKNQVAYFQTVGNTYYPTILSKEEAKNPNLARDAASLMDLNSF
jgi:hypothetical protein